MRDIYRKLMSFCLCFSMVFCLSITAFAKKNSEGVTPIMSSASASRSTAEKWAKGKGATEEFISLAAIYWELAPKIGINPAMAYCQSALETGFGNFRGVIDASFHNPCGLKVTDTSGFTDSDHEPDAHMRFPDWETGISAHLDHLALYVGAPGYPKADTYDPRHFSYLYGRCGNQIEYTDDAHQGLRSWTSANNDVYGNHIISLMEDLESKEPDEPITVSPYTENGQLWLADCDSVNGWWIAGGTEIQVENDSRGMTSMRIKNYSDFKDHPVGVGSMAFMDYSDGIFADVTPYNYIKFSVWCSIDYASSGRNNDYFQINFVKNTSGEQDGYNLNIPASSIHSGWNNYVFYIPDMNPSVDWADWSKVNRLRFTWFNMSNGESVEFNVDDIVCYKDVDPVKPSPADIMCSCERDSEDVFDFCGNSHSVNDGGVYVNPLAVTGTFSDNQSLYNILYCRVGRNYGDSEYTRCYNYSNYYQFEVLLKPENDNTLVITHGNEKNVMEWQFASKRDVLGGKWQRAEIKIDDISKSAVQGNVTFGLNNVDLLHFAQTEKGHITFKNIAVVTEQYAKERYAAEKEFIDAVNAVGSVDSNSKEALDAAFSARDKALEFINVQTDEFLTASQTLEQLQSDFNSLKDIIKGDADLNGVVEVNDALLCLQHAVGKTVLEGNAFIAADIYGRGIITVDDALTILQAAVGKINI